jgi:hypothetical protein
MARDPYARMFRFQMGQCVQWAEHPTAPYFVCQRRWTQRANFAPVVEYLLCEQGMHGTAVGWAYEPDLVAWDARVPTGA